MSKIKIVEDDKTIYEELKTLLMSHGYEVTDEDTCDLYLLDVNLPGKSGYELCMEIRKKSKTPVIFLTSQDTPQDELFAFNLGADDFVTKPYNPAVLLARIGRLLKKDTNVLEKNGLTLKVAELVMSYNGNEAPLTKNESQILYILMQGDVVTKTELIEKLWTNKLYIDENTLYVNITRLRNKMRDIGATDFLKTIRGVGYKL
ncbi:MAG TPA: response regulator transcription factor [Lachnospiraceae bacterium]|nr:response regulator transcription factor [Lachnospiraceae bacterium]